MENQLDRDYQALMSEIIRKGTKKEDRTGTGTRSLFATEIRHDMRTGFPLLTTKKMAWKAMVVELLWFLKGDTNIKYLVDNGCNIWNGDAYKNYKENKGTLGMGMEAFIENIKTNDKFAEKWGELGPIYGTQWREWDYTDIDQIKNLINDLKNNPDSRRLMVSAWNVGELDRMTLPPCHYGFQCYVSDGKLSLMWNQRSVDTFLGLPFNIASYGTLLLLLCEETGYTPGDLIGNLGDVHIYNNHIEQVKEQLQRE